MSKLTSRKLDIFLRHLYKNFQGYIVVTLFSLLIIGFGIGLFSSYRLSAWLVESQAKQYAQTAVKTLNTARQFYSDRVVMRLREMDGVTVGAEYHTIEGGIPNPATYNIEIGDKLSDPAQGLLFRLYSDYPFPNRIETGGPNDPFEWEALRTLRQNPEGAFYRKEELNGHLTFRYTEAVRMDASCVKCHNTLPNSPRKDWHEGDVRGIVEVTQPLDNIMLIAKDGIGSIYTSLAITFALAILGLSLVLIRFQMVNQDLEDKVRVRTAELRRQATLDGLTQLANRRQFDQHLEQEWQRAKQQQHPLSLILCDVDYFKQFNDTYGHQTGDECLKKIATTLAQSINHSGALTARYGGEEFGIILPNTNVLEAENFARSIRQNIHQLNIPHATSKVSNRVTISMGVAILESTNNHSIGELIESADQALYCAKENGRDRIEKVVEGLSVRLWG